MLRERPWIYWPIYFHFKALTRKHSNEMWPTDFERQYKLVKMKGCVSLNYTPVISIFCVHCVLQTKAVPLIVSECSRHLCGICIAFGNQSGSEGSQGRKRKWEATTFPTFTRLLKFLFGLGRIPHQRLVIRLQAVQLSLGDLTFQNSVKLKESIRQGHTGITLSYKEVRKTCESMWFVQILGRVQ